MKVSITIDDIRLKSKLNVNQTIIFTENTFSYSILGLTQSYSGVLGDVEGFIQTIPGIYKGNRPIEITEVDKVHLKYDCVNESTVNGVRETILYSFALSPPRTKNIQRT